VKVDELGAIRLTSFVAKSRPTLNYRLCGDSREDAPQAGVVPDSASRPSPAAGFKFAEAMFAAFPELKAA